MRTIETFDDFREVYYELADTDGSDYASVIVDTLTNIQQLAVEEVAGKNKKRSDKTPGEFGTLTKRNWGDVASLMKTWIDNYRRLPLNLCFIAQDRTFNFDPDDEEANDEDEQLLPEVGPRLMPSVASYLNAGMAVIGNTFIRTREVKKKGEKTTRTKIEYCLRLGPNPIYVTKVRNPRTVKTPSLIVDPTFEDIMDVIKGDYE